VHSEYQALPAYCVSKIVECTTISSLSSIAPSAPTAPFSDTTMGSDQAKSWPSYSRIRVVTDELKELTNSMFLTALSSDQGRRVSRTPSSRNRSLVEATWKTLGRQLCDANDAGLLWITRTRVTLDDLDECATHELIFSSAATIQELFSTACDSDSAVSGKSVASVPQLGALVLVQCVLYDIAGFLRDTDRWREADCFGSDGSTDVPKPLSRQIEGLALLLATALIGCASDWTSGYGFYLPGGLVHLDDSHLAGAYAFLTEVMRQQYTVGPEGSNDYYYTVAVVSCSLFILSNYDGTNFPMNSLWCDRASTAVGCLLKAWRDDRVLESDRVCDRLFLGCFRTAVGMVDYHNGVTSANSKSRNRVWLPYCNGAGQMQHGSIDWNSRQRRTSGKRVMCSPPQTGTSGTANLAVVNSGSVFDFL
jgi:hypothetical protein